jgi:hypothetical protein
MDTKMNGQQDCLYYVYSPIGKKNTFMIQINSTTQITAQDIKWRHYKVVCANHILDKNCPGNYYQIRSNINETSFLMPCSGYSPIFPCSLSGVSFSLLCMVSDS